MALAPMTTFICKVASRCNLDCDYCFVYHLADQSWRAQPVKMALPTAAQLGRRINEHAVAHELKSVQVTMHGGEPLSLGVDYLEQLCVTVSENTPDVAVTFGMQTNGTLFTQELLDFCLRWNIAIGLSLDGPAKYNDIHRVDHRGQSSFAAVEQGLQCLTSSKGRQLWSGILAVIDLQYNPLEVYSYFRSLSPPNIDFLFPLGHYDMLPPGKEEFSNTPYADWLLKIFYVWYREQPQKIMIRRFSDIISLMLGSNRSSEEYGLQPVDFIVVETNGEIQGVDTLKSTYHGAAHLGLNIFQNSFDDALTSPFVISRQERWSVLSPTCQSCDLVKICGGGYFPHRYSHKNGFHNPSIYCTDLMVLIREIHQTVKEDLDRIRLSKDMV